MRIKTFKESISGWELVGKDMGPNYPQSKLQNTIDSSDTSVLMGFDQNMYTQDDHFDLYQLYLKSGGKENLSSFNKSNLDKLIQYFS